MSISKTIIQTLRSDETIQDYLGAIDFADCPVATTFNFEDTHRSQINISLEYGETLPWSCGDIHHDGTVRVYILVKDTITHPFSPIDLSDKIAVRVLELLDLKGSTLDGSIYWVQKIGSDFTHYDDIHFYETALSFRFVKKEA